MQECVSVVQRQLSNHSAISWWEQVNFQWNDDEVRFELDKYAELDFIVLAHWTNSQRLDVSPLGHIIPIPHQPVFALSP